MSTPTHWDNISRIGNTHFTTARGAERNWNRYYFATYTRVVRSMLEGESRGTAFDCGTSYGDWLRFLRDPIMNFCFKMETKKRIAALRRYFATRSATA